MKNKNGFTLMELITGIWIGFVVGFFILILIVAGHFVLKFW
jgi:hypothetical protein